jgi:hypothetical protein
VDRKQVADGVRQKLETVTAAADKHYNAYQQCLGALNVLQKLLAEIEAAEDGDAQNAAAAKE